MRPWYKVVMHNILSVLLTIPALVCLVWWGILWYVFATLLLMAPKSFMIVTGYITVSILASWLLVKLYDWSSE